MPTRERDLWVGHIQAFLYPVRFEDDPILGLDRAFELVVRKRALNSDPRAYVDAIRQALASGTTSLPSSAVS